MPKKPDYKREKKLREAAQRKRNEEAEQRKSARKQPAEGATDSAVTTKAFP